MKVSCQQFDEILERQAPAELAALEEHARGCAACAGQLRLEREITAAAPGLRRAWESPALWTRIERGLRSEMRAQQTRRGTGMPPLGMYWQRAVAAALLLAVSAGATWVALNRAAVTDLDPQVSISDKQGLIQDETLREVEAAEAAYVKAIDKLAQQAEPRLTQSPSPIFTNYREKLLVLDSAIAELRAQSERNRFNAHLRLELLSLYKDKQQTLRQVIEEGR
jgi:hypothetical protein